MLRAHDLIDTIHSVPCLVHFRRDESWGRDEFVAMDIIARPRHRVRCSIFRTRLTLLRTNYPFFAFYCPCLAAF